MVCVSTQTGECLGLDKGSRSMDGSCPGSQGRGWVKRNCVGIFEVCIWRQYVCPAEADVWDMLS